jgi:acetyl-CoA carboxylase carboxyl transferase subunit alpha
LGGAHHDSALAARTLKSHLLKNLEELKAISASDRLKARYAKFRAYGKYKEKTEAVVGEGAAQEQSA